jgi:hypothetical protein
LTAMARAALVVALLALSALAPVSAQAASAKQPWATVNVCDTKTHPDAIGIRALIPGAQRKTVRLFMRFRVQWKDPSDQMWHNLIDEGDSGYVAFGPSKDGLGREGGRLFPFDAPEAGKTLRLRGRVDFEWRIDGQVVKRAMALTSKGHRSAAGSDPKGYSAADCVLKGPAS